VALDFEPAELSGPELDLQLEVRAFLAAELPRGSFEPGLGMAAAADPGFSRKLGARGWLGMALPRRYGGAERSAVERFVVVEELLRWGAPVAHHWVADRQSGPMIARFGSETQKQRFLPPICRGEPCFAIGMSEPEAGSDLAAVRTRALREPGGWRVHGTKIWTTSAQRADWLIALVRSDERAERHAGLSQLIVDLRAPGVAIHPIPFLDGSEDFGQVVLDGVFVPDDLLLGEAGRGWAQVGSELALERAGPERWLSTYLVVEQFVRERSGSALGETALELLGEACARWWGLRRLSLSVARALDRGRTAAAEAALVKELGTRFEQEVLGRLEQLVELEPCREARSLFERLLTRAILTTPAVTIRGGTLEILRSVIARELRE
jgi:alkylation response protein AidB-like acyl-CoA dehydrogenase